MDKVWFWRTRYRRILLGAAFYTRVKELNQPNKLILASEKNPMVGSKDMIDDHGSRKMIDGYGSRKMFRYAENIDLYITACVKILMATTRLASLYCKFYALMISKHKSSKKFSEHDLSGRLPGGDEIFFSGVLSLMENQTPGYKANTSVVR